MKKLTQGMAQQNKTMATAISDEEKANIVKFTPILNYYQAFIIFYLFNTLFLLLFAENSKAERHYRFENVQ